MTNQWSTIIHYDSLWVHPEMGYSEVATLKIMEKMTTIHDYPLELGYTILRQTPKEIIDSLRYRIPCREQNKTGDIGLNIPIQIAKKTSTIHDDFLHIIRLRQAGPSCFFAAGSVLAKKPTNFGPTPPMAATAWWLMVHMVGGTYYMVDLDGMPYQYWIHGGMMTWSLDQIMTWSWLDHEMLPMLGKGLWSTKGCS